jgi:hypothetical protein
MPRPTSRLVLGVMLTACRRPSPAIVEDAAPAAPPTTTVVSATSSTATSAATDARFVIEQWNRAHNEHDADKLAALYAPKVLFYGATLSKADCAKKKGLAFAATPDYVQSTRDAKPEPAEAGRTFVRLVKTSTSKGKSKDYPAILVVDASGHITEESDDLPEDWCIDEQAGMIFPMGNDRVIAPFRMSAIGAIIKARSSAYFSRLPNPVGDIAVTCAHRCAIQAHDCGFSFRLHDMNRHSADDPTLTVSSLLGVVEVEPVTKTLWWEDFAADGASVWHSEQL